MKIALYELYKALKSKVLLILFVALFLLNLALSATYTPVLGVPDECIREINKVYLSTSEEEKLSVAESIANKYIKDNVLQNIFPDKKYEDKLNRVKNYNTTIRNIKSEAEQRSKPSVFSKENSFTQLSFTLSLFVILFSYFMTDYLPATLLQEWWQMYRSLSREHLTIALRCFEETPAVVLSTLGPQSFQEPL